MLPDIVNELKMVASLPNIMTTLIHYLLCLLLFSTHLHGEPQEPAKAKEPSHLTGEVAGKRISLSIFPIDAKPLKGKLEGTRFINVEPGCIMVEAYVTLVSEKELEIRMPHDDGETQRAMELIGLSSKHLLVAFEPANAANQAASIVAITSRGKLNKPSAPSD